MAEIGKSEKAPKNIVHEQAILVETIKKELREKKLYENFSINPFTKREIIASKPNNYPDELEDEADSNYLEISSIKFFILLILFNQYSKLHLLKW